MTDAAEAERGIGMRPRQEGTRSPCSRPYQVAVRRAAEELRGEPETWLRRWAPTLCSVEHLRHLVPADRQDAFFSQSAGSTDWEAHAHGGYTLAVQGEMPSVDELAAYFNGQILPATVAPSTREEYDGM